MMRVMRFPKQSCVGKIDRGRERPAADLGVNALQDFLVRLLEEKKLDQVKAYKVLLTLFKTMELIQWSSFQVRVCTCGRCVCVFVCVRACVYVCACVR